MGYYPSMDWQPPLHPKQTAFLTLTYSDHFDYPLNLDQLWFWQIASHHSRSRLSSWPYRTGDYYHLKGRSKLVKIRTSREHISSLKLNKARHMGNILRFVPSVQAVFITGALAMHNSPQNDDVDIMLVVTPHSLWITRLLVVVLFTLLGFRRPPHLSEHSSPRVRDKICDNLYLDTDHLEISHLPYNQFPANYSTNLYLSHEILQAKCIFDRGGVHKNFLQSNSWVRKYLPVAYQETMKQLSETTNSYQLKAKSLSVLLFTFNFLLFTLQYLYMRSHLTREKIGLGYAFFHPNFPLQDV